VGTCACGQRHAEASGNPRESVTPPAVAERDGDRDHVRPLPPRDPLQAADEFSEEIVGIELLDDQLQECARPRECPRACGKEPQHARTKLTLPLTGARASLTVVAGTLQKAGLITYHRGHVHIVDGDQLEAASCECYRAATNLLHGVTTGWKSR
jgi:hypothetical protein